MTTHTSQTNDVIATLGSDTPNDTRPFVLHVRVVNGSGGGPDKTILRSARHIDQSRIRMAAAYIRPKDDEGFDTIREHAAAENCELWEIAESSAIDPRTVHRLLQLCRRTNVKIWHGHDYKSNLLGLLLRRVYPMHLVTTVHGWTWDTARTRFYYHLDNWCLSHYDEVVVVSPKLYEHCLTNGVPAEKLTYIPNAIRPDEYKRTQTREQAKQSLGIEPTAKAIGVIGRLSVEKGVDRAISTLAQLRETNPNTQLHIIGDGPQRETLESHAAILNLQKNVKFWGWQKKSQPFYEAMDCLLLPSHTEGLPNVVLEAMAMGVPVAATDVGGVRDLLDNGSCGHILATEKPETWAAPIAQLLDSTELQQQFATDARNRIETNFSFDYRMQRMTEIYERVMPGLSRLAA